MKYLYYYMWFVQAKFSIALQRPLYKIILSIRKLYFKTRKFNKYEIQERTKKFNNRIKNLNKHNYNFPDGITHWHAFGFTYLTILIFFFFIPLFTIDSFGETFIDTILKVYIYYL
ncbi:hypothetical protein TFHFJT_360011 [Tenacibaculum finnmarkense]|nr:hypothetical protein TFHFJT_360011 [Tenacibaculum finnmarkense]